MPEPTSPEPSQSNVNTPITPATAAAGKKVLERMLDRLFAALVSGPGLNCRPHRSRQRVDFAGLAHLNDLPPAEALRELIGEKRKVSLKARAAKPGAAQAAPALPDADEEIDEPAGRLVDQPTTPPDAERRIAPISAADEEGFHPEPAATESGEPDDADPPNADATPAAGDVDPSTPDEAPVADGPAGRAPRDKRRGFRNGRGKPDRDEQAVLLQKLHIIADDARTYEQDTGVHVLNVGFPLLSLPPSFAGGSAGRQATRRVLAPLAFIPVSLALRHGASKTVDLSCRAEGIDLVQPNEALLAWLQRQTGRPIDENLFADEKGQDPWWEICALVKQVCQLVDLPVPGEFEWISTPEDRSDDNPSTAPDAPSVVTGKDDSRPTELGDTEPDERQTDAPSEPSEAKPGWHGLAYSPAREGVDQPVDAAVTGEPIPSDDAKHGQRSTAAHATPQDTAARTDALVLVPAPRVDENDAEPRIVAAAVLGLFPMANQGLLRDMQEMVNDPASITGPLERFIRLGHLLEAPRPGTPTSSSAIPRKADEDVGVPGTRTADLARPVATPRAFTDERLVTDADPCQARAVRLARQSDALVIHGPPGTGKSQTIANIIGDHLARGQKVLFVCEKRTALDVVAHRLDHMGLGDLVGVVHDPQRDQRDLYRKIREHLEKLPDIKTDHRAADKLRRIDEELQSLHAELAGYSGALTHVDPESGHSFHELMGQWLAASPPAALGGKGPSANWRVSVSDAAAKDMGQVRLRDLAPLEHPLAEMHSRGVKAGYATNPWTQAAGATPIDGWHGLAYSPARANAMSPPAIVPADRDTHGQRSTAAHATPRTAAGGSTLGLADLLGRPVEQNQRAMDAVVTAAEMADETSRDREPLMPPFAATGDLLQQAEARVALADRVESMLPQMLPDVLDRWAARPLADIRAARARLTEANPYLSAFGSQPLDPVLRSAWLSHVGSNDLPDTADLQQQRAAVQKYADAFGTSMEWVTRVRETAPGAKWPIVAHWLTTETTVAAAALKKLDAAAPLADRAATPIDPELLAQFRRQPFDMPQLLRWQSAIETYLPIAKSILGFLHGGKKKAAAPAVEFFGLGLTAESATRVRDFLASLKSRLLLREALVDAKVTSPDDDAELVSAFTAHRAVLKAAADLHRPHLPDAANAPDAPALVNRMVSEELSAAEPVLAMMALTPTPEDARKAIAFLQALTVRVVLQGINENVLQAPTPDGLMEDRDLELSLRCHRELFDTAIAATGDPGTADAWPPVAAALVDRDQLPATLAALRKSPVRAAAIVAALQSLLDADLFAAAWARQIDAGLRKGDTFAPLAIALRDRLPTLEDVVRVSEALNKLPASVRNAAGELLGQSASPAEAWDVLRRDVLASEIRRRLTSSPELQSVDGHRLATTFDQYRKRDREKRDLVRDVILDQWIDKQKDRLLSEKHDRLSGLGAELRRRLLLRGERAIRLRQVVQRGRSIEQGDPLFDVCPVWMVSPETAAQVFPREAIFDVVVFDEASQCRLEEALPVLTRGRRVVIAGDPKQLPPTRFFESAFAASDEEDEPDDEQGWFEQQQAEVEDLLTAALGLDAQQSYLDVHYRSKNAALIEFSNAHFYNSRLQPIPGHPGRRAAFPPIRLHRVATGVYEKRKNEAEADAVVALVKELLSRKNAPSIGIACFNLVQRDLIVEKLDDLAADDARFAKKFDASRERVGQGSFEGLFVKNLENVQGDERDHMIISTTYGPDAAGKFYRRFGPLAMPGGGRRLNVLVTRARQEVHLVTSIPESAYRAAPEAVEGQTPGGGWLLFAYLRYADELARAYGVAPETPATTEAPFVAPSDVVETEPAAKRDPVQIRPTRAPSSFTEALAHKLSAMHGAEADVYWGNDGFCVDLALRPGTDDADQSAEPGGTAPGVDGGRETEAIGILCDAARFAPADDLMEWDVFRTAMLESQGWTLRRVWTPHFFRDPKRAVKQLVE